MLNLVLFGPPGAGKGTQSENLIKKYKLIHVSTDDDAHKLTKRISEYFDKTIHVLPYYEQQNKLSKVNGMNPIETVYADLCAVIDSY